MNELSVSIKKTHINRNRTFLIILGIILACILTLDANAFYSTYNFLPKETSVNKLEESKDLDGKVYTARLNFIKTLTEKFTSLR